jgi:hypothetical protein
MTPLTELAKQCGAFRFQQYVRLTNAQLTAFAERIRLEERERAETDAKRYRWLRQWMGRQDECPLLEIVPETPEELDAIIDAAIREAGHE